jgi:hypothetical protein
MFDSLRIEATWNLLLIDAYIWFKAEFWGKMHFADYSSYTADICTLRILVCWENSNEIKWTVTANLL